MDQKIRFTSQIPSRYELEQIEKTFVKVWNSQIAQQMIPIKNALESINMNHVQLMVQEMNKIQLSLVEPLREQMAAIGKVAEVLTGMGQMFTFKLDDLVPDIENIHNVRLAVVPPQARPLTTDDSEWIVEEVADRVRHSLIQSIQPIFVDIESKTVFCDPKNEASCSFKSEKRLILLLALGHQFKPTNELADHLDYADARVVTTTIQKLRKTLSTKLGIDGKFIEGNPGQGYRLSPEYTVLLKEDMKRFGA